MERNILGIFADRNKARQFSSFTIGKTQSVEPVPQEVITKLIKDFRKMGAAIKRQQNNTAVIQCNPPAHTVVLLPKGAAVYQIGITEEFKSYLAKFGSQFSVVCTENGIQNIREWAKNTNVGEKVYFSTMLRTDV